VNSDEAVTISAAIQEGALAGNVTDILLLDVTVRGRFFFSICHSQ